MRRAASLVVLLAMAGARADEAAYRRDFETLCNVEKLSGASKFKDPAQRASKVATFLVRPEIGAEVKQFMVMLAAQDPCDKPRKLRAQALKLGLKSCAFADSSEKESKKACADRPMLKDDLVAMCNAEKPSGAIKLKDPEERFQAVHRHLLARRMGGKTSAEFNDFYDRLSDVELCRRGPMLEKIAAEVGVAPCALAEKWKVELCGPHPDHDH